MYTKKVQIWISVFGVLKKFNWNKASLSFGRTSAGIEWCFLGALWHYLYTFSMYIQLIMTFLTYGWEILIICFVQRSLSLFTFLVYFLRYGKKLWCCKQKNPYDDPENFRQKYTCITIREISQQWCCIYHTDEKSWYG